jgi:hypothetical protein
MATRWLDAIAPRAAVEADLQKGDEATSGREFGSERVALLSLAFGRPASAARSNKSDGS